MRLEASRELLATRGDVWAFLAEPHNLPDWWPGIAGVQPDRRGVAAGARWQVRGGGRAALLRPPRAEDLLLVDRVAAPELLAFRLVRERLGVEVRLAASSNDRTVATVAVEGSWLFGHRRSLPRRALSGLYALCQTSASVDAEV